MSFKNDDIIWCYMPSKAINNDDNNNDLTSNREEEKPQLVENKQSEEQLPIG